jgi:hypothetical protein
MDIFIEKKKFESILKELQIGSLWLAESQQSHFILPCLTGSVDYPFASRHKGPGFKTPGGYLCGTRILQLVLTCYIGDPGVILSLASSPSVGASIGFVPIMCKSGASAPFSGCFTRLHAGKV